MGRNQENPDSLAYTPFSANVVVSTPTDIVSGPTGTLTEFVVTNGGAPPNPTTIAIVMGNLSVLNAGWVPFTLLTLTYTRGPAPYVLANGAELAGFSLPVPYP